MKMNPKAAALGAMAEEGGNYKEPMSKSADMEEDDTEGGSAVKCKCGCDVVCKDCQMAPEDCSC
jgi:hypothetical protein